MADELKRIVEAVKGIDEGINNLKVKNAGLEEWKNNTTGRIDNLHNKTIPELRERLSKVEAFQIKMSVMIGLGMVIFPLAMQYALTAIFGD